MTTAALNELYTVVENTSGRECQFAFLGPRGMRLAAGETASIRGDLVASLGAKSHLRATTRQFDALERALTNGDLVIRSRPAPILYDETGSSAQLVEIDDGQVGAADPTYN